MKNGTATASGPVESEIDGHSLKLGLLSVDEATRVLSQLAKMVGPGLAEATTEASGAAVVGRIFAEHDTDTLLHLVKRLLRACVFDGKPLFTDAGQPAFYDVAFRGNLVLLFKVVAFALKANLGDFSGPLALLQDRMEALRGLGARAANGDAGDTSGSAGPSGASFAQGSQA